MKAASTVICLMSIVLCCGIGNADAGTNMDVTAGVHGVKGFYVAASEYYHIPEREIIVIHERHIRDEEIPVVLFIAQKARVPYAGVLDLRIKGMSWIDITRYYRLNPGIYYVPVRRGYGPPYGKSYGYYKKHPEKEWVGARLDDDEIVNLVNLRFISNLYGYAPERIMKMRSAGRNFVVIHDEVLNRHSGKFNTKENHIDRYGYARKHDNGR